MCSHIDKIYNVGNMKIIYKKEIKKLKVRRIWIKAACLLKKRETVWKFVSFFAIKWMCEWINENIFVFMCDFAYVFKWMYVNKKRKHSYKENKKINY